MMNNKNKLLLIGFSGAGKTYLLEKLAVLGLSTRDLDQMVLARNGAAYKTTSSLIHSIGLEHFRKNEFELLKDFLARGKEEILALGGGTLDQPLIIEWLNAQNYWNALWVAPSFEQCWNGLCQRGDSVMISWGKEKASEIYKKRQRQFQRLKKLIVVKNADHVLEAYKNNPDFLQKLL